MTQENSYRLWCCLIAIFIITIPNFYAFDSSQRCTNDHEKTNLAVESEILQEYTMQVPKIFDIFDIFGGKKIGPGDETNDEPYTLDRIKSMTLEELNWTETDIDGDGYARLTFTYPDPTNTSRNKTFTVIEGTFGGSESLGNDTYTMVPLESLQVGNVSDLKTIHLLHGATLVIPGGYPNETGYGYGFFANTHDVPIGTNATNESLDLWLIVVNLIATFEVPILFAGEYAQNWESFGFQSQDGILYPSILAFLLRNEYSADAIKMVYMYPLVRMNLMAHTLFQRLLEKEGNIPFKKTLEKGFFSEGGSKQGYARWLIGILDDRVTVLQADACQVQDLSEASTFYYKDWGVPPIRNSTEDDWANYSNQVASVLISLGEGMKAGASIPTSPGVLAHDVFDIYPQRHRLQSKFISITGDIGGGEWEWDDEDKEWEYDLLHDGTYFPLGSETRFLEALDGFEWRYGRIQTKHALGYTDDVPIFEDRQINNILNALDQTVNFNLTKWPKVENVDTVIEQRNETTNYFNVTAFIKYMQSNTTVWLWYAANSDRRWNDPEHTAPPFNWTRVKMVEIDNNTFFASVNISTEWMYGYYVETETPGKVFVLGESTMYDASPVKFIQEYPPEATGAADLFITNIDISNSNPNVSETVWVNVTFNAHRINIWFEGPYPAPPLVNIETGLYVNDMYETSTTSDIVFTSFVSLQWKPEQRGTYTLRVDIDYNKLLPERNEHNNTAEITVVVKGPDIWLTEIELSHLEPVEGDTLYINTTVQSIDVVPTDITVALFFNDTFIAAQNVVIGTSTNISFIHTLSAGTYTLRIEADYYDNVTEVNELNNMKETTLIVSEKPKPPLPDISLTVSIEPEVLTEGKIVYINATINAVNLTETEIKVELKVDDKSIDTKQILLNVTAKVCFKWIAVKGLHKITVIADADNVVEESTEDNNIMTTEIEVKKEEELKIEFPIALIATGIGAIVVCIIIITLFVKFVELTRKKAGKK